jgi:glucose-6-phosphate 1-dehydrogenase
MDLATEGDYVRLKDYLDLQHDEQALIYLSVPPSAAADIVDFLGLAELNTPNIKLLFEKPFGFDLASAEDFVARTGRYFKEEQLYRIDHYMAKEVAAEVIRLRSIDDHARDWGNESVTSVEIIASEKIGIEDRAHFYEETGALRDFIQGHLMQLLSLVLMNLDPPFSIDDLAERRLAALEQVKLADPEKAKRAQYEGYQQEVENTGSTTETFASLELTSDDPQWAGVRLCLTTGKNLDKKQSAIIIHYKDGGEHVFDEATIASTDERLPDAYERVLVEAIRGRKYIFTSSPEVIRSWQIVAPVQEAWAMDNEALPVYKPGTPAGDLL